MSVSWMSVVMGLEMGSGMGFSLSFLVYKKSNTLGVFPGAILISGKRRNGAGLLGWLVGWLVIINLVFRVD